MPFKMTKLVHAITIHSSIDMIVRSFLLVAFSARTLLARAIWADSGRHLSRTNNSGCADLCCVLVANSM